jgi:hypothetical protein
MSRNLTADDRLALIRIKIERAKKHIVDLESEVGACFAANPYEASTRRDLQTGKLICYVSRVSPVPTSFATIAGDAFKIFGVHSTIWLNNCFWSEPMMPVRGGMCTF